MRHQIRGVPSGPWRSGTKERNLPRVSVYEGASAKMKTPSAWAVAMWFIPVVLASPAAGAEDQKVKERAARKACLSGNFAQGVEILSDLFIDTRDPTYIFNQGRCFEQNNRYDEALGRFLQRGATTRTMLTAGGTTGSTALLTYSVFPNIA
jgi:hypothetical protein